MITEKSGNNDSDDDVISQSGFSNGSSDGRIHSNEHQKDGDELIVNGLQENLYMKMI